MKKTSSFLLFFFLCIGCSNKEQNEATSEVKNKKDDVPWFSFGEKGKTYHTDQLTISLEPKPVKELLEEHHFDNDSIYKVYETALSKNCYFILKLSPDNKYQAMPKVNENILKESSYMIVCKDTVGAIETTQLIDFGTSKSKQLLLVFPKIKEIIDCKIQVSVGGAINRFDRYNFQIDSE